ncbi:SDR family NAD(P)-dependent oxidoreductase [Agromyces silvae]|uniref:SDR family NAD(P)-dependent oxidoreductase n=1 Tax=Agromyces silvae TaxID=3388266 RepID=UPI00280A6F0B|nr:SDR family oxidoreductase [Agromyces protaetiae]
MSALAVVTGAAGGIGGAIAERLARDGFDLVLVDQADASETAGRIRDAGGVAEAIALDLRDARLVDETFRELDAAGDGVSAVVLSHGVGGPRVPLAEADPHEIDRIIQINLTAAAYVIRAAAGVMRPRRRGRIVAVASAAGKEGNPGVAAYSASKAGLLGLVKAVAREVAEDGVLVNAVAPGPTATPMIAQAPDLVRYVIDRTPLGRLAQPQEVAAAVAWLVSEECSFTTGSALDLSGGRSAY